MPRNRSEIEPEWMLAISNAVRKCCKLEMAYMAVRTPEGLAATNAHWDSMSQQDRDAYHKMPRAQHKEVAARCAS